MIGPANECQAGRIPELSRWLLLEHPGPWDHRIGADDPVVTPGISAAARLRRIRLNLVRRPGTSWGAGQMSFLVSSEDGRRFVERLALDDLHRRLPETLDAVAESRPSGAGDLVSEPLYLVCTHGRRTPVCGQRGAEVLRELTGQVGVQAWETTHVGGCALAVNLVCLPAGVHYSLVEPESASAIVRATREGRISPAQYRGRAGLPADVQAAELEVRRRTGIESLDGIRLVDRRIVSPGEREITFDTVAGRYRVTLGGGRRGSLGFAVAAMRHA